MEEGVTQEDRMEFLRWKVTMLQGECTRLRRIASRALEDLLAATGGPQPSRETLSYWTRLQHDMVEAEKDV